MTLIYPRHDSRVPLELEIRNLSTQVDLLRTRSERVLGVVEGLPGSTASANAVHSNVAGEFTSVTEKPTPGMDDLILIEDFSDSGAKKIIRAGNLPGGVTVDDSGNIVTPGTVRIGTSPSELDNLDVDGTIRLDHTAVENDDHALEIDINAAGFSDVKVIDIDFITGSIGSGESEAIILINIDETSAGGGDVSALEVLATEGSADNINALFVGATIHPIIQLSGTFANAESISNDGADVLTALSSGGAGNISAFVADDDFLTIGHSAKFEEIEAILDTGSSGPGIKPTFEYSTGSGTWASFGPTDGTNAFRNTGIIAWLDSDIPSWAVGAGSEFLIRITRTRTNITTTPIIDKIQISADTLYSWDKNGDQVINNLSLGGKISLGFGDIVSEQNPDAVDAIRIKGTSSDIDIVIGGITDFFSVWNAADDTAVFFVNNVGDTDILGDATIVGDILLGGTVDGRDVATDGTKLDTIATNADVGDVSAAANMTDNTLLKGDGGAKGIQDSGITLSATDQMDEVLNVSFVEEHDNGVSGSSITIDWAANDEHQKVTLTDDCTLTFTAPRGVGNHILKVIQDGTGGRTVTWPATVKWAGGTAPTLSTGASAVDLIAIYYDGTNYYSGARLDNS